MDGFIILRETNLDYSKDYWLVAYPKDKTLHGYLFFNPMLVGYWTEEKSAAQSYARIESAEAQVELIKSIGEMEPK